jgi:hypothetical protein
MMQGIKYALAFLAGCGYYTLWVLAIVFGCEISKHPGEPPLPLANLLWLPVAVATLVIIVAIVNWIGMHWKDP